MQKALTSGAIGYISKFSPASELFEGLSKFARGEEFISSNLAHLWQPEAPVQVRANDDYSDPLATLSPRTVETHRARVVRKLGITTNAELIRFAIKHGLSVV